MPGKFEVPRCGGAMRSGQPSSFMSPTASEFRHDPSTGRPCDDSSKRIVLLLGAGSRALYCGRVFLKNAISMSLKRLFGFGAGDDVDDVPDVGVVVIDSGSRTQIHTYF